MGLREIRRQLERALTGALRSGQVRVVGAEPLVQRRMRRREAGVGRTISGVELDGPAEQIGG